MTGTVVADFLAEAVWTAALAFDCAPGFLAADFTAAFFTGAFFFAAEAAGWTPQANAAIDRAAAQVRIVRMFSELV